MGSKYFGNNKFTSTADIKEQLRILARKAPATQASGKVKNVKGAFGSAKKKASTNRTGSQRGS